MWEAVSAGAARCCRVLWDAGFEAYPVGGCVRDLLLGRAPGDWDVTTNARPEQVMNFFDRVIATGVKHGTVTVWMGDEPMEVTTFRGESGYSDGRHPDQVCFVATLEEDLSRRDFTINAMALAPDGAVIDPFEGRKDLQRRIVRCVGEPAQRFSEDGLRMFRAIRFAAQLDFDLDGATKRAVGECAHMARHVAAERVRVELEKTLCAVRADDVWSFFDLGLMRGRAGGTPQPLTQLNLLPAQPLLRWAGLCGGLLRDGCVEHAAEFLERLHLERRVILACEAGERLWRGGLPECEEDWRRALAQYGPNGCRAGAAMGQMCGRSEALAVLERVIGQRPCVSVRQLALSGTQLMEAGLQGTRIGEAQRYLLEHVLARPQDNRTEVLRGKLLEFMGP